MLGVLDGAILVVSPVEGVQAQTRLLMRALQRLQVPTALFVNKIDRRGASYERTLANIAVRLTPAIVSMGYVADAGTPAASFASHDENDENDAGFTDRLVELLAEQDDELLTAYVGRDARLPLAMTCKALATQSKQALVVPILRGSAMTGAGVHEFVACFTDLLPTAHGDHQDKRGEGDRRRQCGVQALAAPSPATPRAALIARLFCNLCSS